MLNGRIISADLGLLRIEAGKIIIRALRDIEVESQVHAFLRPENIVLSKTSAQSSIRNSL